MTGGVNTIGGPWTRVHIDHWLTEAEGHLTTADGRPIRCMLFQHKPDEQLLSEWARHFRNHYCCDGEIDALRAGTGLSRSEYLQQLIFPDIKQPPGPSIRSGDFAEILVADFLEYSLGYWVPRFRYDSKSSRNESTKGADILGILVAGDGESKDDVLAVLEAKASLGARATGNRLQDAVDDSERDVLVRVPETLNALKRRLIGRGDSAAARRVQRFQNSADHPYREVFGAAVVFSTSAFDSDIAGKTDTSSHPRSADLFLVVISGDDLLTLANELYDRAANEA